MKKFLYCMGPPVLAMVFAIMFSFLNATSSTTSTFPKNYGIDETVVTETIQTTTDARMSAENVVTPVNTMTSYWATSLYNTNESNPATENYQTSVLNNTFVMISADLAHYNVFTTSQTFVFSEEKTSAMLELTTRTVAQNMFFEPVLVLKHPDFAFVSNFNSLNLEIMMLPIVFGTQTEEEVLTIFDTFDATAMDSTTAKTLQTIPINGETEVLTVFDTFATMNTTTTGQDELFKAGAIMPLKFLNKSDANNGWKKEVATGTTSSVENDNAIYAMEQKITNAGFLNQNGAES